MQNISDLYFDKNKEINIVVKTIDSQTYNLKITPEKTIAELKESISKLSKINAKNQRLIYQGKVLKDIDKIKDYKIYNDHVIHLVKIEPNSNLNNDTNNDVPILRNPFTQDANLGESLNSILNNRINRASNIESEVNNYQNYFNSLLSSLNNINTNNALDFNRLMQNLDSNITTESAIVIPECILLFLF